jgi:glyoxylase-like metal-dependent hydrolase (beta-lactamase superfamily II)
MPRTLEQLGKAADLFREKEDSCSTSEAKSALLEIGRSRLHRRHSSLLLTCKRQKIMIDCGADWLGMIESVSPHAIFLTHAHPDHAWGLAEGTGCPVCAPDERWGWR